MLFFSALETREDALGNLVGGALLVTTVDQVIGHGALDSSGSNRVLQVLE